MLSGKQRELARQKFDSAAGAGAVSDAGSDGHEVTVACLVGSLLEQHALPGGLGQVGVGEGGASDEAGGGREGEDVTGVCGGCLCGLSPPSLKVSVALPLSASMGRGTGNTLAGDGL